MTNTRVLISILACASIVAQTSVTRAREPDQALADAQSAWAEFRSAFNVTFAQIVNTWPDPEDKSTTLQNLLTIKLDGPRYVGIVETPKDDRWEGNAYGKNDRYRFELRRYSREQPWVIVGLTHEPGDDPQAIWIPQVASYPFNINTVALDELARHSVFQVTDMQEDSAGLVAMSFQISDPQERMSDGTIIVFSSGQVTLDPTRNWLPVRKTFMWGPGRGPGRRGGGVGGEATDFRTEAGISFPTKWTAFNVGEDGSPSEPYGTETVTELQLGGSVPYHEFTLSAFGLPEPGGSRGVPGYVWLAIIAVVALAVGGMLRSRARRAVIA